MALVDKLNLFSGNYIEYSPDEFTKDNSNYQEMRQKFLKQHEELLETMDISVMKYVFEKNRGEVIKSCKQAIKIDPDYAETHFNLGVAYGESGKYQKAIKALKQAIRINPDDAEVHYCLGVAYYESGKHEEAIKSYKQAIRIDPDYARAHNNLGNAYFESGKYEDAIESYKQAIRIDPDYADAHYNLACSYSLLGDVNKALESLGRSIDLGFDDIKHIENDSDLNGLRDEAGYKKLINKLKS